MPGQNPKVASAGRDLFRREIAKAFTVLRDTNEPCCLCGDAKTGACSRCVAALMNLSRDKRRELYRELIEIGDRHRAEKFARYFTVHKPDKPDTPVRDVRKRLGLTQVEMAEKLGCGRRQLSYAENGQRPLPALAQRRLEQLQGVPTDPCSKPPGNPRQQGVSNPIFEDRGFAETARARTG